jgi:OOP family OmpA-OmpF porin
MKYNDHMTYGLRIGINTNDFIIDQFELGYDYSRDVDYYEKHFAEIVDPYFYNILKGEGSIHRIYFNAIKEFEVSKSAKLYALAGIGWESFLEDKGKSDWLYEEFEKHHEKDGTFGQYGAGLKYYFTDNTALKAEVRHGIKFDSPHRSNLYYTLGLSYTFGGDKQSLPQKTEYLAETTITMSEKTTVKESEEAAVKTVVLTQKSFNFDFGSAQVLDSGEAILKEVAQDLKANPNLKIKILIEGHADSTGSSKYNTKLSQKRADAVKNKLAEYGIEADKIETEAYGEDKPVATNETKEGRAKNRRVEIIFVQ